MLGYLYIFLLAFLLWGFYRDTVLPSFSKDIQRICIVGDSVSAGIGGRDEKTWPLQLAELGSYEVLNLAISGATVNSALHQQVPKVPAEKPLVLLEIGGNDLFGPTPISEFQHDLEGILAQLKEKGDVVAMFELPVLPWQWRYSRVQRILAQRYDILLIPKRVMASVFSEPGMTSDLAHLTPKGHQRMALTIQRLLEKKNSYNWF